MSRAEAIQQLREMNAQSVVKVSSDFVTIVKDAKYREEFVEFTEDSTIKVVDLHNSIIRYVRRIMPNRVTAESIETTGEGLLQCCPLMARLYQNSHFDPESTTKKWGMIARNIKEINGIPLSIPNYRPIVAISANRQTAQRTFIRPVAETAEEQEDRVRKRLHEEFSKNDENLEQNDPRLKRQKVDSSEKNRWNYSAAPTDTTNPNINKSEQPEAELCNICMNDVITHGFLHYGLSGQDPSMHFIACKTCANTWMWATKGCPKCRQPVINVVRVTM